MIDNLILTKAKTDDAALEQILTALAQSLVRLSHRYYLAGLDSDDLLIEAKLGVVEGVRSYDALKCKNAESFLFNCARRQVITACTKRKRDSALDGSLRGAYHYDVLPDAQDVTQTVIDGDDIARHLRSARDAMTTAEYAVYSQFVTQQLGGAYGGYAIVANTLNINVRRVETLLTSARSKALTSLQCNSI